MPTAVRTLGETIGISAFTAALGQVGFRFESPVARCDEFGGAMRFRSAGDIQAIEIDAEDLGILCHPGTVGGAFGNLMVFLYVREGSVRVRQGTGESELNEGEMCLCNLSDRFELHLKLASRVSMLVFPRELLLLPAGIPGGLVIMREDDGPDIGSILRSYFSHLPPHLAVAESRVTRRLLRTGVDMVSLLVESVLGDRNWAGLGARGELMLRITDYIYEHLSESSLDPRRIAMAHYISVRHLQALFTAEGTTVTRFIKHCRLQRCYDELSDPRSGRTITSIALDNGFVDPAHFSRTFRAHFGVTPRSVRASIAA